MSRWPWPPVRYVVSLNLHRRHLSESQRGMVGDRLAQLPKGANQHSSIELSTFTQDEAAELMNTSRSNVQRARTVIEKGTPELAAPPGSGTSC